MSLFLYIVSRGVIVNSSKMQKDIDVCSCLNLESIHNCIKIWLYFVKIDKFSLSKFVFLQLKK